MQKNENINPSAEAKLTVYFDGLCYLCSHEIEKYKSMKGSENILFVDITSTNFSAQNENLDPVKVNQVIHIKDATGKLHTDVDGFILLWQHLPTMSWLAKCIQFKPIYIIAKIFYHAFARTRHLLPKRKCGNSPYCEFGRK